MKIVLRVLGVIVLILLVAVAVVYAWGEPISRMPGRHLHGTVITQPVEDWSFAAPSKGVICQFEVESDPPRAVNIACIGKDKNLYVGHNTLPNQRPSWAELLALNPAVARVRFGKNIYPVAAVPVTDPAERQGVWDTGYIPLHRNGVPASPPGNFLLFRLVSR